jgi:hypothetical protein
VFARNRVDERDRPDPAVERAGTDYGDGMVIKRKGMRWRTFNRLMDRANALSTGADATFLCRLQRLGFASIEDLLTVVTET